MKKIFLVLLLIFPALAPAKLRVCLIHGSLSASTRQRDLTNPSVWKSKIVFYVTLSGK
jgi:hypothetical protein